MSCKKSKKSCKNNCCNTIFKDGRALNIIAATTANIIAGKFTNDELAVLAIFFSTLSNALGTIAAADSLICETGDDTPLFVEESIN